MAAVENLALIEKYQRTVTSTIPLTDYMQWRIVRLDPWQIQTNIDLLPNINIHGTAFAGSIYASAMATGWTLLKCWYDFQGYQAELVAAEASIRYLQPVAGDFVCRALIDPNQASYEKLTKRLGMNKSCGYPLTVEVICAEKICAILTISFVFKCSS